jgi:hypothetical protein
MKAMAPRRRPSLIWLAPIVGVAAFGFLSFRALEARRASAADARARAAVELEPTVAPSPPSAPRLAPAPAPAMRPAQQASDPVDPPASWQTYKVKLDGEGTDARWSERTAADIRKVVAELALPGTTLVSARCAQTVCEVVFDHSSHEHQLKAPMSLTTGPFATGVHYRYEGLRTTAYLQR